MNPLPEDLAALLVRRAIRIQRVEKPTPPYNPTNRLFPRPGEGSAISEGYTSTDNED